MTARELAEKIHRGICCLCDSYDLTTECEPDIDELASELAAFAASVVARESAEQEKALLAVIDERDTLEGDIENIARELGCEQDATNLHSHSECAISAAMSVDDRIKAVVARERERWRDTLQDLADEYILSACEDECNHRRCVARKRALCAANTLLDVMREVKS